MLTTFYLLVSGHIIADFMLQFGGIASKKKRLNKYMLIHIAIVALLFFIPLYNYPAARTVTATVFLAVFHLLIDIVKIELDSLLKLEPENKLYWISLGFDQLLHLTVIYILFNKMVIS